MFSTPVVGLLCSTSLERRTPPLCIFEPPGNLQVRDPYGHEAIKDCPFHMTNCLINVSAVSGGMRSLYKTAVQSAPEWPHCDIFPSQVRVSKYTALCGMCQASGCGCKCQHTCEKICHYRQIRCQKYGRTSGRLHVKWIQTELARPNQSVCVRIDVPATLSDYMPGRIIEPILSEKFFCRQRVLPTCRMRVLRFSQDIRTAMSSPACDCKPHHSIRHSAGDGRYATQNGRSNYKLNFRIPSGNQTWLAGKFTIDRYFSY